MKDNKQLFAHLSVLSANLIYGANYTIAKGVMPEFIQPFGFIFIRVTITALIFILIDDLLFTRKRQKVENKDKFRLALCALFGIAINQLLFFKGLSITSPINAALIMTTNPIMVLIVAGILIREKVSTRKVTGIFIGIAGAVSLILFGKHFAFNNGDIRGDILVLINSLSFGVFLIIVKPMMQKYRPITVMKWIFLFGSFYVIPFGYDEFKNVNFSGFPTHIWLSVAYVVIATTSVVYLLNSFALKNLSPSNVSSYIYLQPVFATAFAIALGKDNLHVLHVVSSLLIFFGVYLVSSASSNKVQAKKS